VDDKLLLPGVFSGQCCFCFCFLVVSDRWTAGWTQCGTLMVFLSAKSKGL
jgi:hypothetical protein